MKWEICRSSLITTTPSLGAHLNSSSTRQKRNHLQNKKKTKHILTEPNIALLSINPNVWRHLLNRFDAQKKSGFENVNKNDFLFMKKKYSNKISPINLWKSRNKTNFSKKNSEFLFAKIISFLENPPKFLIGEIKFPVGVVCWSIFIFSSEALSKNLIKSTERHYPPCSQIERCVHLKWCLFRLP